MKRATQITMSIGVILALLSALFKEMKGDYKQLLIIAILVLLISMILYLVTLFRNQ